MLIDADIDADADAKLSRTTQTLSPNHTLNNQKHDNYLLRIRPHTRTSSEQQVAITTTSDITVHPSLASPSLAIFRHVACRQFPRPSIFCTVESSEL